MVAATRPAVRIKMVNLNNTTNPILQQALQLSKKGWSIIPIGKNKKPLIKWTGFQKEPATEEQIVEWLSKYPNTNIAVVTGQVSNLVVVDIDPRHGGTQDDFKDIATVKVKTGGGGWHYYFQYELGIPNRAHIRQGIDIRGEGGYVILPPSVHDSGKLYEWETDPTHPIAQLPNFLKEWTKATKINQFGNWNSNILNGVQEGSRNEMAASVAGKLLTLFPRDKWSTETLSLLKAWNSRNIPPLPEQELRNVFESITKREVAKDKVSKGTETPQGIQKEALLNTAVTYQEVEEKVRLFLPNSGTALKIVLAVAVSANFKINVMLWMLLVGVPSSGKTDLVRLLKDAEVTYYLDNLTQNAFISGERASGRNKVYDLLPLIDKKCLIIKDWTSIFSLDEKMTKKLLGDLVGIYDKEFTKFSSRRGNISYKSAFSQLGCITPATLNRHTNYMNMVGPRFLCYTMPTLTQEDSEESYDIIFSNQDRSLIEKEARLYASTYLSQLTQAQPSIEPFEAQIIRYLRIAAELMSNCRGIVILQSASFKNEEDEEVKYYEVSEVQIEEPWRAVQQLLHLAKYLAFVIGKNTVDAEELAIIKEVVVSSMPADRSQALRSLKSHQGIITAKELSDLSQKSHRTSRRLLDELTALKVVEKIPGTGSIANDYKVIDRFRDFLLSDPAEFMSTYSSGTETPPVIEEKAEQLSYEDLTSREN